MHHYFGPTSALSDLAQGLCQVAEQPSVKSLLVLSCDGDFGVGRCGCIAGCGWGLFVVFVYFFCGV